MAVRASSIVIAADEGKLSELKTALQMFPLKVDTMHNGYTALQAAARRGRLEIIKHLVREHADVNFCDIDDQTPLHYAVNGDQPAAVDLLLKLGARMDEENIFGFTAPQVAFKNNYNECVRIFMEKDQNVNLKVQSDSESIQVNKSEPNTENPSNEEEEGGSNSRSVPTQKCIYCNEDMDVLITFKPCGCRVSCFKCSSQVACKNCGRPVEHVSNQSEEYKLFIKRYKEMEKQIDSLKQDKTCIICRSNTVNCTLKCGHLYCIDCVTKSKEPKSNPNRPTWICPQCSRSSRYLRIYMPQSKSY